VTDKPTIVVEIDAVVGATFEAWQIGLTNDPTHRKRQLKDSHKVDVSRWRQWRAESVEDARAIMQTFLTNGMQPARSVCATTCACRLQEAAISFRYFECWLPAECVSRIGTSRLPVSLTS